MRVVPQAPAALSLRPCLRALCAGSALLFAAGTAQGQMAKESVGQGEFPGLQLLPPGSVLRGISLPRYEKHRVTALFAAERMEIKTRSLLAVTGVRAELYDQDGSTTAIDCKDALYDFAAARITSTTPAGLKSPRLEAKGSCVIFSTERNIGLLKGPVTSAIRSDGANLQPAQGDKKQ